ncbi:hypothetical protein DRE_02217 [Drechslerella stenobrocha 248]|uniref:Uncharacterized protein n=1 Tax=Drechslerella stenobrocha 248 TaxID=1043628 RepID=W7I819_9PEZI|nr:hypothetical protein DRE_02217 [Drechslerella stenobrocha 248]
MPVPQPPAPLGQHCTTIVDDTLYAYTEKGFFKLPLSSGGNWTEVKGNQVITKRPVCVHMGHGTGDESLYVVGGEVSPSEEKKNPTYNGLQKYSFAQKKWEIKPLQDQTMFNLTHHGAGCLTASNEIFTYGGNWFSGDYTPTSMAFRINVGSGEVVSLPTGAAPPLAFPIVQALDASTVIVAGGEGNTQIFSYSTSIGWKDFPNGLSVPLRHDSASGAVVHGDDGSKMFLTFDFSKSPVDVELVPLFNATSPAAAVPKINPRAHELTSANWPNYNATRAPKDTRTDFAIAANNQYVVITGGGPVDDPLCIFNYQEGSWVNAAALFSQRRLGGDLTATMDSDPTSTASTLSRSRTSTATSSALSTSSADMTVLSTGASSTSEPNNAESAPGTQSSAAAAATESSGIKTSTQLLFIILGVVLLVALILGTAYMVLRCKRKKMKAAGNGEKPADSLARGGRRDSGMSFKDRGASFMKEAGGSKANMFGGGGKSRSIRGRSLKEDLEFANVGDLPRGATIGPALGTTLEMQPAHRGSGWSRYFSGNSTTNLVQNDAGLHRNTSNASRSSYSISEFPDEPDERRQSYPSIGYVRSSYASHSAVFSTDLPTPTFGDVMRDNSPPNGSGNVGLLGFEPPRAPGLFERSTGSQISVSSAGASSINFFGEAVSHPDFAKKVAHAQAKFSPTTEKQVPEAARVVSSIYSDDRDSALQPPSSQFGRTDSFGFFGNERQGTQPPPRGDQGLGWFVRD